MRERRHWQARRATGDVDRLEYVETMLLGRVAQPERNVGLIGNGCRRLSVASDGLRAFDAVIV